MPLPAGCRLQTRPSWTRCLYWAFLMHRTTGERGRGRTEGRETDTRLGLDQENSKASGYSYLSTILNNYLECSLETRNHEKLREEQPLRCILVTAHVCPCNVNVARKTEAQSISHWAVMNCGTLKERWALPSPALMLVNIQSAMLIYYIHRGCGYVVYRALYMNPLKCN